MSSSFPLALAVFSAGASGVSAFLAARNFSRARLIADTPKCDTRSAPQGYVELHGRALRTEDPPLVAPLSGTRCVWYRFYVQERGIGGFRTTRSGVSDDLFLLQDETGAVLIDPARAQVFPTAREFWATQTTRSMEELIREGASIYALGSLHAADAPSLDVEGEARGLLREWKRDRATLWQRFDRNRDGRIDAEEWQQAQAAAHAAAAQSVRGKLLTDTAPLKTLRAPRDKRPYILSGHPEGRLVRRLRWSAALYTLGFFLAGAIASATLKNLF